MTLAPKPTPEASRGLQAILETFFGPDAAPDGELVEIRMLVKGKKGGTSAFFQHFGDDQILLQSLVAVIEKKALYTGSYFGCSTRLEGAIPDILTRPPLPGKKPRVPVALAHGVSGSFGGDATCLASSGALWVDIDDLGPDPEVCRAEALKRLEATKLPAPTMAWFTGNGVQLAWKLHERFSLKEKVSREAFKETLVLLCKSLDGDMKSAEPSRILRVPGTMNRKYDPAREGRLLWAGGEAVTYSGIRECLAASGMTLPARVLVGAPATEAATADRRKPSLFVVDSPERRKELVDSLVAHWPAAGGRHETVMALAGVLWDENVPPEIAELIVRELATAVGEDPGRVESDYTRTVRDTYRKALDGEKVTGRSLLKEKLGEVTGAAILHKVAAYAGAVHRSEPWLGGRLGTVLPPCDPDGNGYIIEADGKIWHQKMRTRSVKEKEETESGARWVSRLEFYPERKLISEYPVWFSGYGRDMDSPRRDPLFIVNWAKRGTDATEWKTYRVIIPSSALGNRNRLINYREQFPAVTTSNANTFIDMLNAMEAHSEKLNRVNIVRKNGWIDGTGLFVMGETVIGLVDPGVEIVASVEGRQFTPKENYTDFIDMVGPLVKRNPGLAMMFSCVFSAPLIGYVGDEAKPFIAYLGKQAAQAKTFSAGLAVSGFGNPEDMTLDCASLATAVGVETFLERSNDQPVVVDNVHRLPTRRMSGHDMTAEDLAYRVHAGTGKARGRMSETGRVVEADKKKWRTVALVLSESPAFLNEVARQGAETRFIDIHETIREVLTPEAMSGLTKVSRTTRGALGAQFIRNLASMTPDARETWNRERIGYIDRFMSIPAAAPWITKLGVKGSRRVAEYFAIIAMATDGLRSLGMPMQNTMELIGGYFTGRIHTLADTGNDAFKALCHLATIHAKRPTLFYGTLKDTNGDPRMPNEIYGILPAYVTGSGVEATRAIRERTPVVVFYLDAARMVLTEAGYDFSSFLKTATDEEWVATLPPVPGAPERSKLAGRKLAGILPRMAPVGYSANFRMPGLVFLAENETVREAFHVEAPAEKPPSESEPDAVEDSDSIPSFDFGGAEKTGKGALDE